MSSMTRQQHRELIAAIDRLGVRITNAANALILIIAIAAVAIMFVITA